MFIKKQHNKTTNLGELKKLKQPCYLKTSTFNKNLSLCNRPEICQNNKLTISFKSYATCQAKDTSSTINSIEKLIDYLNSVCGEQLHTYFEFRPVKWSFYSKAHKQFSPVVLSFFTPSYTNLLNCQSTMLPRYQKQQSYRRAIHYKNRCNSNSKVVVSQQTDDLKQNHNFAERFEHNSYFDRCFFKLCKRFSSISSVNKRLVQRRNSKKLLTVIRAPFVFKKTRQQFSLQTVSSHTVITLANAAQKKFVIQNLRLLKLPTELKLVSHN
uniref:Ribosomal protein S10 n=1 Tax=Ulva compressa TaxID=63659 RepID=A0A3S6PAZ9_ULVCO|nr:ribosomal protein S10 [Ulva compressa]ATP01492.1 ribosomal protein S10 [Ulva compressa]